MDGYVNVEHGLANSAGEFTMDVSNFANDTNSVADVAGLFLTIA